MSENLSLAEKIGTIIAMSIVLPSGIIALILYIASGGNLPNIITTIGALIFWACVFTSTLLEWKKESSVKNG